MAAKTGLELRARAELREIQLGDWEGLDRDQLAVRYPELWTRWQQRPSWDLVPEGERARVFEARVDAELKWLFGQHRQGEVLVVTHGGFIQVALSGWLGQGSDGPFRFRIENASISRLEERRGRLVISGVNDTCHLDGLTG